jgi:hypothetical protein
MFPSSLHLSTLPSMGRVCSTESYPHPPVKVACKVIKQTRVEPFDRPPLLLPSQISVVETRDLTQTETLSFAGFSPGFESTK